MFDAHTATRREQIWFSQFGRTQNTVIATVSGLIFAALTVGYLWVTL